jgi:tetratricopeptide (TPR) repeat protein
LAYKTALYFQAKWIDTQFNKLPALTSQNAAEAIKKSQALLNIDSTNLNALSKKAEALYVEARLEPAHSQLCRQNLMEARSLQAEVLRRLPNNQKAKLLNIRIHLELARMYSELENSEEALNMTEGLNFVPMNSEEAALKSSLFKMKGELLKNLNRPLEAKEMFIKAYELKKMNYWLLRLLIFSKVKGIL